MLTIDIIITVLLAGVTVKTILDGWVALPETSIRKIVGFGMLTAVLASGIGFIGLEFSSLGVLVAGGIRVLFDIVRNTRRMA